MLITSVAARSASSAFTPTAYKVSKLVACRLVESVDADARAAAGEVCAASGCGADAADGGAYRRVLGEE